MCCLIKAECTSEAAVKEYKYLSDSTATDEPRTELLTCQFVDHVPHIKTSGTETEDPR